MQELKVSGQGYLILREIYLDLDPILIRRITNILLGLNRKWRNGERLSVVFFDENNKPTRDPIIWMDVRSSEEAKFIESIDDPARGYNGYSKVSAEWFPCKNLWVKKNQPEVYKRSKVIAEYTDWITFELTGEWTLGINTTSVREYYDNEKGGFPKEFYKKIGLEDIFEKLPRRVLKLGEVAGRLRKEIADKTGLPEGIPVAQGGADAFIAVTYLIKGFMLRVFLGPILMQ